MPKANRILVYRKHTRSGQAVVTLPTASGRVDVYLGVYDAPESHQAYDRTILSWLESGRSDPTIPGNNATAERVSISEISLAFVRYAEQHYRKPDGSTTYELTNYKLVIKIMRNLYGSTPAESFGPRALALCRRRMIELGWCRNFINRQVGRLKTFKNHSSPPSTATAG